MTKSFMKTFIILSFLLTLCNTCSANCFLGKNTDIRACMMQEQQMQMQRQQLELQKQQMIQQQQMMYEQQRQQQQMLEMQRKQMNNMNYGYIY